MAILSWCGVAVTGNRGSGIWFDVPDARPWPKAMREFRENGPMKMARAESGDSTQSLENTPHSGLSLEELNLFLTGNIYSIAPGQGLFRWGASWRKNQSYASLEEVQSELKLENESRIGTLEFVDYLSRDFRVPEDSLLIRMNCYPSGPVPGVRFGLIDP